MRNVFIAFSLAVVITSCGVKQKVYHFAEGPVHGTSYHITYEYFQNSKLEDDIVDVMEEIDMSLSTYIPGSIISRVNNNDPDVEPDEYFTTVFERGRQISERTGGAFDMTVAPLVNAYGFGFDERKTITGELIEELLKITGYDKIRIEDGRIIKDNPRIMLDASAIAKGFSVDMVSGLLERKGVDNYLVEIGGEVRCRGLNPKGLKWKIGVDKPLENMLGREIQIVLNLSDISLATSGNYRQFYEEGTTRYSHTIDPSTGKPVTHNLLSATVLASDCMTADAYATAFMVMGLDKSLELVNSDEGLQGYFIYSNEEGEFRTAYSRGLEAFIEGGSQAGSL